MAIQVRCDFTPSEFDLIRAVLTEYAEDQRAESKEDTSTPKERHEAGTRAAQATFLLEKLQG